MPKELYSYNYNYNYNLRIDVRLEYCQLQKCCRSLVHASELLVLLQVILNS